ncbi:uncharacterized protein LOC119085161 [Bradysia coprophila]|uniref:uncharacterized protein LOC119085161 n=1 Tax=Bradysia coprophila TaxID=38358 RepID=UPI00187D893F|nr:uncharacterized protein LOC119085161 [Bradysia coprophila]
MSGIEICDLPNELITQILRNLSQDDLQNASLTCKLWKNLIESSCRWSLLLYHNNEVDVDEPWIDFMLSTNRKFDTIKLDMIMFMDKNKTLEIFQKHGPSVVNLHLMGSCIDSFIELAKVLKCMPNLKHVIVLETSTTCGVDDVPLLSDLPDLPKLKTLEMLGSEYSIVKCFHKSKLTTMKIFNSYHDYSLNCKPLEEFLKSQEMLTTLAFRSLHQHTSTIFRTKTLNQSMPFNLTHLSLLNLRLQESPNGYNNMLAFMKPHAKTLKVLELGRYFPSFVFEFVFANMTRLETITLMMTEIPKDDSFHERLEEHRNIKNLIFSNSAGYNDETSHFLGDFLKKLPNVNSLTIRDYCGNRELRVMAAGIPKLESLDVYSFNQRLFDGVRFPELKSLRIHQMDEDIDWEDFTQANSRLIELTINQIFDEEFLNHDNMEIIATNLNLQCLRLGESVSADKRFFEIVREKCPDLQILDLHESNVPDEVMDQLKCVRLCDSNAFERMEYSRFWNDYDGRLPYDESDDDDNGWMAGAGMLGPFDPYLMGIDFGYDDVNADNYEDFNAPGWHVDDDEDLYDLDDLGDEY